MTSTCRSKLTSLFVGIVSLVSAVTILGGAEAEAIGFRSLGISGGMPIPQGYSYQSFTGGWSVAIDTAADSTLFSDHFVPSASLGFQHYSLRTVSSTSYNLVSATFGLTMWGSPRGADGSDRVSSSAAAPKNSRNPRRVPKDSASRPDNRADSGDGGDSDRAPLRRGGAIDPFFAVQLGPVMDWLLFDATSSQINASVGLAVHITPGVAVRVSDRFDVIASMPIQANILSKVLWVFNPTLGVRMGL